MATSWSKFYPRVQPYIPGCPEIVIESHLQEAAAEFCAKSEIWRLTLDPDFTSKNTSDYELDIPTDAIVENLLFLYLNGTLLTHVSERHSALPMKSDGSMVTGSPVSYSTIDDASVRMYPTPDGKYTFVGVVIIKPKLSATGVEDFIFESHGRSIADGAIARIAGIPNKEWSDPELAIVRQLAFARAIATAKGRDTRRINMQVAPVNFA